MGETLCSAKVNFFFVLFFFFGGGGGGECLLRAILTQTYLQITPGFKPCTALFNNPLSNGETNSLHLSRLSKTRLI